MVSPDMLNWETAEEFAQHYRGRGIISPDMLNWEMVPHLRTEERLGSRCRWLWLLFYYWSCSGTSAYGDSDLSR
jgi:hypothetical protein